MSTNNAITIEDNFIDPNADTLPQGLTLGSCCELCGDICYGEQAIAEECPCCGGHTDTFLTATAPLTEADAERAYMYDELFWIDAVPGLLRAGGHWLALSALPQLALFLSAYQMVA